MMRRRVALSFVMLLLTGWIQRPLAQSTGAIAVQGDHFTVDGGPKFLIFVSYFDALRASPAAWNTDLQWLQSKGISGVRVLANWQRYCAGLDSNDGVIGENGVVNSARLANLELFLAKAQEYGIVVDVTFTHNTMTGPDVALGDYRAALQSVAASIAEHENVIIDVSNEWNKYSIDGSPITGFTISQMVQSVKTGDPTRAATGSTEQNYPTPGTFEGVYDLGFVAHHEPRGTNWYLATTIENVVNAIRTRLKATPNRAKPIYLQEPRPFDPGCLNNADTETTMSRAAEAVANAKFKGAAAWTFHNRASFNLLGTTLQQAIASAGETAAVEGLFNATNGVDWGVGIFTGSNNPTVGPSPGNSSISLTRWQDPTGGSIGEWVVMSTPPSWLHLPATSGTGQTVAFSYEANPTPNVRQATLNISGLLVTVTQQPARARTSDFDGDGKSDLTVFRPSTGEWHIRQSNGPALTIQWGLRGDVPVAADYDADGRVDLAVYRPTTGTWYISKSSGGSDTTQWGLPGDQPAPGDYDGDGKSDLAIFRTAEGKWYIRLSSTLVQDVRSFGLPGDLPVAGDYDADGRTDTAIYRPALGWWFVKLAAGGEFDSQWGLPGDVPVVGDYDGDGRADRAVFRGYNSGGAGVWLIKSTATQIETSQAYGLERDIPVPADYDGDADTDLAVFRPSTSTWHVLNGPAPVGWGLWGDIPLPVRPAVPHTRADFDGDGATDVSVFRPADGTWHVVPSAAQSSFSLQWGFSGDVPVAADYNGDGATEVVVYRPSTTTWHNSLGGTTLTTNGSASDIPVPGDYNGDGRADIAMFRVSSGNWEIWQSSSPPVPFQWGLPGDVPVPGDYTGDGLTDPAVYRPSNGTWWVMGGQQSAIVGSVSAGDVAVPADYDGDRRVDLATYRPSTGLWQILLSSTGTVTTVTLGTSTDIPVPGDYDGDDRSDVAVFRPATGQWLIVRSGGLTAPTPQWGLNGDIPVPKRP